MATSLWEIPIDFPVLRYFRLYFYWFFWCQDQKARDHALNGLKQGRIRVLVATDVAARGLDIKGIGASTSRRDFGESSPHGSRIDYLMK